MKMSTSNGGTSCFDSRVSVCSLDTRGVRGTGSLPLHASTFFPVSKNICDFTYSLDVVLSLVLFDFALF